MLGAVVGPLLGGYVYSKFGVLGLTVLTVAASLALVKYRDTVNLVQLFTSLVLFVAVLAF